MSRLVNNTLALLNSALNNENQSLSLSEEDISRLLVLAERHNITAMIADAMKKCEINIPESLCKKVSGEIKVQTARCLLFKNESERICSALLKENIKCALLKGETVRELYPKPEYRSSSDIDILYDEQKTETMKDVLFLLGFSLDDETAKDYIFSANGLMVEMHKRLEDKETDFGGVLNDCLCRSVNCRLTDEDSVVYLLQHMCKHFLHGGAGIRFVCDLYVIKEKNGSLIFNKQIRNMLLSSGMIDFAYSMEKLLEVWFGKGESDSFTDELTMFIFKCSTFGLKENRARYEETDSNFLKKRVFISTSEMGKRYKAVLKAPFLLPLFWIVRAVSSAASEKRIRLIKVESADGKVSVKLARENKSADLYKKMGLRKVK